MSTPFQDWIAFTHAIGGGATTWPFSTGIYGKYYGRPAMKFDVPVYMDVYNRGLLRDRSAPQQLTTNGQYAYVLAPDSASMGAPHVLTPLERVENAAFVAGDTAADALHLPSLADLEGALKEVGRDALLVLAVGSVAWYLLRRRS